MAFVSVVGPLWAKRQSLAQSWHLNWASKGNKSLNVWYLMVISVGYSMKVCIVAVFVIVDFSILCIPPL
jgi:hypothetical protein